MGDQKQVMISVIIPVYNSEKYLHKCIDSVLSQSYTNFEVILVNDGSTDKSGAICDEYASKDKRVKVFNQENKGVSSARNNGLKHASGELICFIDSDDKVLEHYLQNLLDDFYKSDNTDLVFQGNSTILNNEEVNSTSLKEGVISALNYKRLFTYFEVTLNGKPSSKLFKADIIRKNNIAFNENFTYNEDKIFVLEYLKACKGDVIFSKTINYHYYLIQGSLSNSLLKPEKYLMPYKYFKNLIKNEFKINHHEQEYSVIYQNFKSYLHMYVNSVFIYKKGEEKEYLDKMDEEDWEIYKYISKMNSTLSRKGFDFFLLNRMLFPLRVLTSVFLKPLFTLRKV